MSGPLISEAFDIPTPRAPVPGQKGRIVEFSVAMRPTTYFSALVDEAKVKLAERDARPQGIGRGRFEFRVQAAPPELNCPAGYFVWGVVEVFPDGHVEVLMGGAKANATEAAVEGSYAYDALLRARG